MTTLLDRAVEAVRRLPHAEQDEIAQAMMLLAGIEGGEAVALSPAERAAIARSKTEAAHGEFASNAEVRAVWSKHGL